ncbi:hypothetical protein Tco_0472323 [Tanacetum coccineum]
MIVDRWFHTDDIGYMELIKYKGLQVSPAKLDALLVTHYEVQPLLLSCKMIDKAGIMEVFKVSYKPQRILTNSDGSVCSLLKKRIPDVHDSQFVLDVREPLEIEELMDRDVGKVIRNVGTKKFVPNGEKMLRKQLDLCWLLPHKPLLKFGRRRSTIYRVQVSKAKKRLRRSRNPHDCWDNLGYPICFEILWVIPYGSGYFGLSRIKKEEKKKKSQSSQSLCAACHGLKTSKALSISLSAARSPSIK